MSEKTFTNFYRDVVKILYFWLTKDEELFSWDTEEFCSPAFAENWREVASEIVELFQILTHPEDYSKFEILEALLWSTHQAHANGSLLYDYVDEARSLDASTIDSVQERGIDFVYPTWEAELEELSSNKDFSHMSTAQFMC